MVSNIDPVDEWTVKEHVNALKSLRKDKNEKTPKKKKDFKELHALWKGGVPLAVNDLGHDALEVEDEWIADDFNLCVSGEKTEGSRDPLVLSVTI